MTPAGNPAHLDVQAFARTGGDLSGQTPLQSYPRLQAEACGPAPDAPVRWQASGELRAATGGQDQVWLRLRAQARLPMVCQRCLLPMEAVLDVDRAFRFVADEALALAEDDESEEDLLVLSRRFDLSALIEDELLLALPVVPRHDQCPVEVKLAVADEDFERSLQDKPSPFAALRGLSNGKSN